MPNTFRVSVAGGIDAVSDLAFGDGKHVVYMENIDVRGGMARPYNLPLINPNVTVPANSVQVYSYRGRVLFSTARRHYTAEFMDDRERIYWTEYGGYPKKMIEGIEVSLGISRPTGSPIISAGNPVSPSNILMTVTTGGTGTLAKGTTVSFRLAYRTALGVFPASGIIKTDISADNSKITLTWGNPVTDIPVLEIFVFVGTGDSDERYLTALSAHKTSYDYPDVQAASGEFATIYDQALNYQYAITFVRNVEGVQNESGPSGTTPPILASASRKILISPWSDGTLDSMNLVTWAAPAQPSFELVAGSTLPGYASPLTVSSIVSETDTGRILCTFSTNHYFGDGSRILIAGISPDPFSGIPVEIQVEDGMFRSCYLIVSYDFVPPGGSLTGVTAIRVPRVEITDMHYNPSAGSIEVTTSPVHTFAAEKVLFTGFSDTNWNHQQIPVLPNMDDASSFFIDSKSLPSDKVFSGHYANLALTAIKLDGTGTGTMPIVGDILYLDFSSTGATGAAIKEALTTLAVAEDALMVNLGLAGAVAAGGPSYASGIQFVPHNDYLAHRRLYRSGGTESFQLVKEFKMDELEYLDAIPDSGLGDVLPTLYTENDVDVVVEPAPFGLDGLVQHYGMGFAWDPSSNRLVWTLLNNLDAWPPEFYRDFDHRILALASYNYALHVFCEDGVYQMQGTVPTNLIRHKTKAAPCRAGGSVQFLNNNLIYLSDQGLMAYNGQESTCLTDLKIPGEFWLANSRYLEGSEPGGYLVPFVQDAAFERLRGPDLPSVTPRCLMPYLAQHVNQRGIRSFVRYGKYYLYWGGDFPEYEAQTMICVDFSAPGAPITVIGIKAMDAFVDEIEQVHMILTSPVSLNVISWDCPQWVPAGSPSYLFLTVTVSGGSNWSWILDAGENDVNLTTEDGHNTMTIMYIGDRYYFTLSCLVDEATLLSQVVLVGNLT